MKEIARSGKTTTYIIKAIFFCIVFTGLLILLSFFKSSVPGKYERIVHGIIGTIAAFVSFPKVRP